MHQPVKEHFKRRLSALELVAVVLHLLKLIDHHFGVGGRLVKREAQLHSFVNHVALAGKFGNQHAPFISDHRRVNVLVGRTLFHHRAHVDAALVGKGALAHIG